MVNDLNMEEQTEAIGVDDAPSPMSVNQMANEHCTQSQSSVGGEQDQEMIYQKGLGR